MGFIDHLLCADHSKVLGTEWQIRQMWSPRAMTVKGTDDFKRIKQLRSCEEVYCIGERLSEGPCDLEL